MNDQTRQQQIHSITGQWARTVVINTTREIGDPLVTRPIYPGAGTTWEFAEPATGIAVARSLELAARKKARDYIRQAREDGLTWGEIGAALGITVGGHDADHGLATAAFEYAAGPSDSHWNRTYGPSVNWTCPACGSRITDRGPEAGSPHDCEEGHATGCTRLAATVAAWEAPWAEEETSDD
jgi:hypothetical protein